MSGAPLGTGAVADVSWALDAVARDRTTSGLDSMDACPPTNVPPLGQRPVELLRVSSRSPRLWSLFAVTNLNGTLIEVTGNMRRTMWQVRSGPNVAASGPPSWLGTIQPLAFASQALQCVVLPTANANPTHFIQAWICNTSTPEATEMWLESIYRTIAGGAVFSGIAERFDRALRAHDVRAGRLVDALVARVRR